MMCLVSVVTRQIPFCTWINLICRCQHRRGSGDGVIWRLLLSQGQCAHKQDDGQRVDERHHKRPSKDDRDKAHGPLPIVDLVEVGEKRECEEDTGRHYRNIVDPHGRAQAIPLAKVILPLGIRPLLCHKYFSLRKGCGQKYRKHSDESAESAGQYDPDRIARIFTKGVALHTHGRACGLEEQNSDEHASQQGVRQSQGLPQARCFNVNAKYIKDWMPK
mmetsp:Transcript_9438/g.20489  ORF Transcript_9438/g.20489 Transcript_9438/m.20489 type:complete len:218 (-) Transcript_9438:632-1285(-)